MPGSLQNELECKESIQDIPKSMYFKKMTTLLCYSNLLINRLIKNCFIYTFHSGKDEQPKQQKLQKKNQYPESLLNNVKSSYIANKFVTTTKTKNEKNQENKDYIMCEKCTKKKQQKVQFSCNL